MLESSDNMLGSAQALAKHLGLSLERKILDLTIEAFERWEALGFPRSGDSENEFTAGVVGRMREIVRHQHLSFVPRMEVPEHSDDVYAGKTSPNTAPRIDISVTWSFPDPDAYYTVECKRVAPGQMAKFYIIEGMLRFISGKYASKSSSAAMLGYVVRGTPKDVWLDVNSKISSSGPLAVSDSLSQDEPIRGMQSIYKSAHTRKLDGTMFRLTHLFVDVQGRSPLKTN